MDLKNEYGTLNVQKGLLKLLKEFNSFCILHKIEYSLSWGSLLGAVRHNGFIPWDDDLDVMMDRDNYNKLKNMISSYNKLIYLNNSDGLWVDKVILKTSISKRYNIPTLDIFIVDHAPDGKLQRKTMVFKFKLLQGMLKKKPNFSKGSILMRLCSIGTYIMGKFISNKKKLGLYSNWSQKYNSEVTKKLGSYNTVFADLNKLYDADMFDSYEYVPFEDTTVPIIKKYDSCLKIMFGPNYMTPPQDRTPKHIKAKF